MYVLLSYNIWDRNLLTGKFHETLPRILGHSVLIWATSTQSLMAKMAASQGIDNQKIDLHCLISHLDHH